MSTECENSWNPLGKVGFPPRNTCDQVNSVSIGLSAPTTWTVLVDLLAPFQQTSLKNQNRGETCRDSNSEWTEALWWACSSQSTCWRWDSAPSVVSLPNHRSFSSVWLFSRRCLHSRPWQKHHGFVAFLALSASSYQSDWSYSHESKYRTRVLVSGIVARFRASADLFEELEPSPENCDVGPRCAAEGAITHAVSPKK